MKSSKSSGGCCSTCATAPLKQAVKNSGMSKPKMFSASKHGFSFTPKKMK